MDYNDSNFQNFNGNNENAIIFNTSFANNEIDNLVNGSQSDENAINDNSDNSDNPNNSTFNISQRPTSSIQNDGEKVGNKKKKCGRKTNKKNTNNSHNKLSADNIIRKCKCAILNNTLEFINKKIKILYPNITKKSFREKKLFKLKQNQRASSRADYNKSFLSKSLKSIFSEDISTKFINYPPTHNKDAIELLINEKDEKKRNIFNNIFNLTFSDCLNHFRGTNVIDELKGLNQLNDYINEIKEDNMAEEYCNLFKFFIYNFERIINEKKPRKRV